MFRLYRTYKSSLDKFGVFSFRVVYRHIKQNDLVGNVFFCVEKNGNLNLIFHQPVREAVSYRGLFTAGWFGVREKHCSRLEIYDRLRASEQAVSPQTRLTM